MDLGSAMKCKIIIHIFIIPISQRVRVLGTEFETYKILRLLNFRTGNKSINKYLHFYCQSYRTKHGTLNGLEICRSQKLMSQIDMNYIYIMPKEIGNSVWPPEDQTNPQKSLARNSVNYPWSLREMRCLPVKCGVYPWKAMFTRGKEQATPCHP